jgi:guanine deaminase
MDISSRPTYVEASTSASLDATSAFVDACHALVADLPPHERLVEPVLTPRFVPTCSDELLRGLAQLSRLGTKKEHTSTNTLGDAGSCQVPIQSHLLEAYDQLTWVRSTRGKEDIDVFDEAGLLGPGTLQAHCTFVSVPARHGSTCNETSAHSLSDLERLALKGTAVAHCPLSNVYFSEKPFPLREALSLRVEGPASSAQDAQVGHLKLGLGTDIAGGYSSDMMNAMRNAVLVSRMRESERKMRYVDSGEKEQSSSVADAKKDGVEESLAITWKESLYLATRGGAIALCLAPGGGVFRVGSPFDAQMSKSSNPILVTCN